LRAGHADPLGLVTAGWGRGAVGLRLELGGDTSGAASISIVEAQAAVGLSTRFSLAERLDLAPALELGGAWQRFSVSVPYAVRPVGSTLVPGVWVPVLLRWSPVRHLGLGLRVAGAWVRPIEHVDAGSTLWTSGSWRVEAGAWVSWSI
jgi:hypothetical protein